MRPTITVEEFYSRAKKDENSGCWLWQKSVTRGGYGQQGYKMYNYSAHRLSWIFSVGPIPKGLAVCHKCDNPLCINPEHLFLGTQKDNVQDMMKKGRHGARPKKNCVAGHTMEGYNVYVDPRGRRSCRACQNRRDREFRARRCA